jgi:hypothetical protein
MVGQTISLCDGKYYDHDKLSYMSSECSDMLPGMPVTREEQLSGHGGVVYAWDLERYLLGLPVID